MRHQTKDISFHIKSENEQTHQITAYASTFDREPDAYGDVVAKGAFERTIKAHEESGEKIPLLFGHRTDDPMMNIGIVDSMQEDEKGLLINATLDMENENAAYCYKLLKEGRLYKLSFAFDILDHKKIELEDGTKANELRELDVFEVSLVPIPANQHAQIIDVKSNSKEGGDMDELKEIKETLSAIAEKVEQIYQVECVENEKEQIDAEDIEQKPQDGANGCGNSDDEEDRKSEQQKSCDELLEKIKLQLEEK